MIQEGSWLTDHGQLAPVVMVMVTGPPCDGNAWPPELNEYVHKSEGATGTLCKILKSWSPIITTPARVDPLVLGLAETLTVPGPEPV
jgi:hypothetical protein